MVVEELRKSDRFVVNEPMPATFGPSEVLVLNVSLAGIQISHPHPLRLGISARLSFQRGEAAATIQAQVIWSHVAPGPGGKLVYRTGLQLKDLDIHYALALNSLIRAGAIKRDEASLERKRKRDEEREEKKRKSAPTLIPISEPPPA